MNKTFTSILLCVALVASSLTLTSCSTLPTQTQQRRIEVGVQVAAQVGGSIILTEHPEYRGGFEEAIKDLEIISASTNNVNIGHVLAIVQRLNIKELKSPQAILYVSSGILILNEFGVPTELNVNQSDSVRGIAKALAEGLRVAILTVEPTFTPTPKLPPLPPLPPGA